MAADPPRGPAPALAERLSTEDNALGTLRVLLAALVVLGHAFPLGGFAPLTWGPFTHSGLHGLAVDGFFVISGYLILASGRRMRTGPFRWRRALRIYPGYLVAILVTAFAAAPLGALLEPGAHWQAGSAVQYVVGALDLKPSQEGVEETLLQVPWPSTWNGSLWTLFYEVAAYAGIAALCAIGPVRRRLPRIAPPVTALLVAAYVLVPSDVVTTALPEPLGTIAGNGLWLWTFFACGMLLCLLADRLRPGPVVAIAAAAVLLVTVHLTVLPGELSRLIVVPALTITVLWTGAVAPWRLDRHGDLSYGLYIYAFPVQQLLVLAGITRWGWAVTGLACLACTIPLAALSWRLVERPALSWKRLVPVTPHARRSVGISTAPGGS